MGPRLALAALVLLWGCDPMADVLPQEAKVAVATVPACTQFAAQLDSADTRTLCLSARVVAVGLRSVYGVREVGMFHAGGPIPGNPAFLMQTRPGKVLDPRRLLVASADNFGAPLARAQQSPGALLSIDPHIAGPIVVPPQFAATGARAEAAGGAVKLYSAQADAFVNRHYNRQAATADAPGVAGPRYISINNAFGRPWIANSPFGALGAGTSTVLDPDGRPLDNAPSARAGGVFAGRATPRMQTLIHDGRSGVAARALDYRVSGQLTPGDLATGALGTALLGPSPDGSGFAVFAVATANGAVVQVHVQDGVDGLAPPGTLAPVLDGEPGVAGMAFKWNADRALVVADAGRNRLVVLHLGDDSRHFTLQRVAAWQARELQQPIDVAAAIPELANPRFASHTSMAARSDLFVANRGDGSLLRMSVDGRVRARAMVAVPGLGVVGGGRLRALAVAGDATRLWLTLQGELPTHPGYPGVLLEVSAFDAGGAFDRAHASEPVPIDADLAARGEQIFRQELSASDGLGPLFNARSCAACHSDPGIGGMSANEDDFVLRVARVNPVTGRLEPLDGVPSAVARRHALGEAAPDARQALPRAANVTSLRMPPALYDSALIDRVADEAIVAHAVAKGDGIRGRPNRVRTATGEVRIGRYGWKADMAGLDDMVGSAFDNELGITNPLAPRAQRDQPSAFDDDGTRVRAVVAYLRALRAPTR